MEEPHVVVKYYNNASGEHFGTAYCGNLTKQEKRICEKNPGVIGRSPFAYISSKELGLPLDLARRVSAVFKD